MFDDKPWKFLVLFGTGLALLSLSGRQEAHPLTTNPADVILIADTPDEEEPILAWPQQPVTAVVHRVKAEQPSLFFAGEAVPMHRPRVAAKLNKELKSSHYWCSETSPTIRHIRYNLPRIERIIRKQGLPEDFKYVAVAESFFRHEVSPKGAAGIWQLMPHTARELGLVINEEVDERYHLEKSTIAACQYIKKAHKQFGNWTTTAAAYNRGIGGIAQAVKAQRSKLYYDLNLNRETSRYIFRVLAIKEMLENPSKYGISGKRIKVERPEPVKTVKVKESIEDLSGFASEYGLELDELRQLNPWIVGSSLTVTEELPEYKVLVPKKRQKKAAEEINS